MKSYSAFLSAQVSRRRRTSELIYTDGFTLIDCLVILSQTIADISIHFPVLIG